MRVKLGRATDDVGWLSTATGWVFPLTNFPLPSFITCLLLGGAVLTDDGFGLLGGGPGGFGRDFGLLCLVCLVPGLAILSGLGTSCLGTRISSETGNNGED